MADLSLLANEPHRRLNQLTGEWVLVSPHRMQRPWQGQVEARSDERRPRHDAACYLCPGNERSGGQRNPDYAGAWAFDNDFAALRPSRAIPAAPHSSSLLVASAESGLCRVICFSPRHDLSLPELPHAAVRQVVDLWTEQYEELGARNDIGHVQIFENKGAVMGCSNPHPHGQVWAQRSIPREAAHETTRFLDHHARHGRTLISDYLAEEFARDERILFANDGFVALVPFWAVWPYEMMIASRRPVPHLGALAESERDQLAEIVKRVTTRYDNLFETSFPYSAGMHQAPTDGAEHPEWHLHMHFYPPLLRSATVRKFLVGYEMLGEPQRDLTPEAAAERLRALPDVHYREGAP